VTVLSPSGKIRPQTLDAAYAPVEEVLISLKTSEAGVSDQEARNRLAERGFNEVTYRETASLVWQFIRNLRNPFVALLSVLSLIAFCLGDNRAAGLILVMVVVSVLLRFVQEFRSNRTVAKLRNLVRTAVTVLRTNDRGESRRSEVPIREIVPGDIVLLSSSRCSSVVGPRSICQSVGPQWRSPTSRKV
jgi:Mg2+-importing ATPase